MDTYELEYHDTHGFIWGENVRLDEQGLWISDHVIGDASATVLLGKVEEPTTPGTQPNQPAPVQPAPTEPVLIDLKSGDYRDPSGTLCDQNIGVGKQNGKITQIMVTYESPCDASFSLSCDKNVCKDGNVGITFKSATSYEFLRSNGQTVLFQRR